MATQEQLKDEEGQYGMAFNEPDVEEAQISDDDAFGLIPESEEPGESGGEGDGEGAVVAIMAPVETPSATPADPVSTDANVDAPSESIDIVAGAEADPAADQAPDAAASSDVMDIEKERQRLKSWEGRLKAMQAELDAKKGGGEAAMAEGGEVQMAEGGETEMKPDSSSMTVDQVVAAFGQDFGSDFVDMLKTLIRHEAAKAAGEAAQHVGRTVEAIIEDINDDRERAHFEKIHDAHPDFMAISESPEFMAFVSQDPDRSRIVESGSAREIVAMLNEFKQGANAAAEDTTPPEGVDDAEGVRSTGLRLPESPAAPQEFQEAWDQF